MSSVVGDDTARTLATGRDTIGGILSTAQTELQKVFIVFVIGFLGTFTALRLWIWEWLEAVTLSGMDPEVREHVVIIVTTPFEVILLQAKLGIVAGIFLALPVLLYLSRRELKERDRWPDLQMSRPRLFGLGILSASLFVGGLVYAYEFFFPFMFEFLATQALNVGVEPTYGIVEWTEFLILLTLSFGLAAQLPLIMTGTSYTGIVAYETYRDKWKYAVIAIFVFGAFFSPPDPFTLMMWAIPLMALYVFSLALAKIATNIRRAGDAGVPVGPGSGIRRWALGVVVVGLLAGLATAFAVADGLLTMLYDDVRPMLPNLIRPTEPLGLGEYVATYGEFGPFVLGAYVALVVVLVPAVIYILVVLRRPVHPPLDAEDPTRIDIGPLTADRVRDVPDEVFEDMTEAEATRYASEALDEDDREKARLVFDRFDRVHADSDEDGSVEAADEEAEEDDPGVIEGTATGVMSALSEDRDEDEIGGYIHDVKFIADSLRSRIFRIFLVFAAVLAIVFTFLYQGGLGAIKDDFITRMPDAVEPEEITVIALHPVEVLIFIVKVSTIAAALAVIPMILYYAWPSMTELGWIEARRGIVYKWTLGTLLALLTGTALGYFVIAPGIMSYLVYDALRAGMVISYRIESFSWLIIFTTVGIGLFMIIPFTMWMLYRGGIASYGAMRDRWREVTIGAFAFAGMFTPASVLSMFLVGIPVMLFYWFGLVGLWIVTLGGRRGKYIQAEPA